MGKLVSGVLGMDSGEKAGREAVAAGNRYAQDVYFKPYTMTTGSGQTSYSPSSGFQSTLSTPYQAMQAQAQMGAMGLLPQYAQAVQQQPQQMQFDYDPQAVGFDYSTQANQFAGTYNPNAEAANIFAQESALLKPEFQKQGTDLQQQLFGSGRLGLRLAGEGAGAGSGGMFQPEAYGLARAQQQTLANVAADATRRSQEAAMNRFGTDLQSFEANQAAQAAARQADLSRFGAGLEGLTAGQQTELNRFNVANQLFGTNTEQQQQYLQNLLGGYQGMFEGAMNISNLENQLLSAGVDAETARSAAAAAAGNVGTSGYAQNTQAALAQDKAIGGLFGGITGGFLGAAGKAGGFGRLFS